MLLVAPIRRSTARREQRHSTIITNLDQRRADAIGLTTVTLKRLTMAGSPIGSIEETQEMLDFCDEATARHAQVSQSVSAEERFTGALARDARDNRSAECMERDTMQNHILGKSRLEVSAIGCDQ